MAWYDRFRPKGFWGKGKKSSDEMLKPFVMPLIAGSSTKARETLDTEYPLTGGITNIISPLDDVGADWKLESLSEEKLASMTFTDILNVLVNASPDLDRALSDMILQINTRPSVLVSPEGSRVSQAQEVLNLAVDQMAYRMKEPLSVKLDKMVASMFLKGAIFLEVIFEKNVFIDIRVLDPHQARWEQRAEDPRNPGRGQYWQLGHEVNGVFRELTSDNIFYLPINALEDKPHGRSMVASAIYPIVFLMGLIKDTRQFVKTQAYPFQLATIDRMKLIEAAGEGNTEIYNKLKELVEELQEKIKADWENATPATQFTYGNEVSIETIGDMGRARLDGVEMLVRLLKEMIVQAVKQLPATFGMQQGNALSTNADQQLELHTTFIDTMQSKVELAVNYCFGRILTNEGYMVMPAFQLQRDNSLVDKQRAERMKLKTESLDLWLAAGVISVQEYRDLLLSPEAFDDLSKILGSDVPADAGMPNQASAPTGPAGEEPADEEGEGEGEGELAAAA